MLELAKERVTKGHQWLDQNYPGWKEKIDLDTLELSSCLNCVLGQLYGHFDNSPFAEDGPEYLHGKEFGFDRFIGQVVTFGDLQEEWEKVLKE